ncbi:hypothetical protein M514_05251 [Trichuris suis]|uniref:GIY-YIG domain-containing protein n=1 Tax=Trichuris suis TaxID=68888 RepID=A0A085M9T8_9BILA|nr:hypothetical protein M513_05251 [Trichuris suis]KFD67370.1 hypothetical protein M514_05251 [Trichuris suis]
MMDRSSVIVTGTAQRASRIPRSHQVLRSRISRPNLTPARTRIKTQVKLSAEERPGTVYNVRCGCGATYIGETGHTVAHRFRQHRTAISAYRTAEMRCRGEITVTKGRPQKKDPRKIMEEAVSSSAVVEHVVTCLYPDNQVTVTKMHHERFFRLRKEALYIRHNRCINRDEGVGISAAVAVATDCATIH